MNYKDIGGNKLDLPDLSFKDIVTKVINFMTAVNVVYNWAKKTLNRILLRKEDKIVAEKIAKTFSDYEKIQEILKNSMDYLLKVLIDSSKAYSLTNKIIELTNNYYSVLSNNSHLQFDVYWSQIISQLNSIEDINAKIEDIYRNELPLRSDENFVIIKESSAVYLDSFKACQNFSISKNIGPFLNSCNTLANASRKIEAISGGLIRKAIKEIF